MLDKRCLSLLNLINQECLNSGYKIFAFEELALSMPSHYGIDCEGVRECLKVLSEREYLSIKYEDDKEVCVTPLTKGRLVFENRIDEELENARAEKRYFLYSFFGALIGGIAIVILTIIVNAVIGGITC